MSKLQATTEKVEKDLSMASDSNNLRLIEYIPEYYAGINKDLLKDRSLVVVFEPNMPVIALTGDQGVTKTSNIYCLQALLGSEEVGNAINEDANTKKASLTLEIHGRKYESKITKTGFSLMEFEELSPGKIKKSEVRTPKTVLQELIGPLGKDPMFLKTMDGNAQVKYIRNLYSPGQKELEFEEEIATKIKNSYSERKDANREVKRFKTILSSSKYYCWDEDNKTIVPNDEYLIAEKEYAQDDTERSKQIQDKYDLAKKRADSHNKSKTLLDTYQKSELEISEEIIRLKKMLQTEEEKLVAVKQRILDGETKIKELEKSPEELAIAIKELAEQGEYKIAKDTFLQIKKIYQEYNTAHNAAVTMSHKYDSHLQIHKKFIQTITPDIEGLEVCIPQPVDLTYESDIYKNIHPQATQEEIDNHVTSLKNETREGIYYNKRSVSQLSESELFSLWILLCKALKIKVAFIENISSLGTDAINSINSFVNGGGVVFYSAMQRGQKELKISFYRNIQ